MKRRIRVAIRVDAATEMGTGHLRRCQSLAQALEGLGAEVVLVVRPLDNVAGKLLQQSTISVNWLPPAVDDQCDASSGDLPPHHAWARVTWQQDASETCEVLSVTPPDWVVVDHYAFDARWHDRVRKGLACQVLVIDDVADRKLSADVLIDHNWATDHRKKYTDRLMKEPVWLTGPRYALVSANYYSAPRYAFQSPVRSVGVFMGGTDPTNATELVLNCIRTQCGFPGPIEMVTTSANPHLHTLKAACASSLATSLSVDEPDLAAFFSRHDLQIGAGGGATWERCCIGPPTIAVIVAENQLASIPALHRMGALNAARLPGTPFNSLSIEVQPLDVVFQHLLADAKARQKLGVNAATLVDGRGAQRIALRLTRQTLQLRTATENDAPMLHAWRNHPSVRTVSLNGAEIAYADHVAWMRSVVGAADRWLLIGQINGLALGSIRFDRLDSRTLVVSLYLDPELQGLGLGKILLLNGEQHMIQRLGIELAILADVIPGNQSSCALFESCGYQGGPSQYTKMLNAKSLQREHIQ